MCVCVHICVHIYAHTHIYSTAIINFCHWTCSKSMFLIEYFHCWPPLILYKLHCLGGVWIMWRQKSLPDPPLPPTPQFSTLSSPSPQVTCSMLVHTHMNEHGSGFTPTCVHTHLCAYTCAAVFITCMSEGGNPPSHHPSTPHPLPITTQPSTPPPPLLFKSTAMEHLCLALPLLSVATVTKAQTGVAAAARARHRGRKQKEREFFFFCLQVLIITTDFETDTHAHNRITLCVRWWWK